MKYFPLLLMALILASCSSRDKMKKETDALLKKANQSLVQGKKDSALIDSAYAAITDFVTQFPKDTLAPAYLFEKSLLQEKQMKYDSVMATLEKIYATYSDSRQAGKAIFLEGFLYANVLNQYDKAREKYQLYLDKYSGLDSKMTNDAKNELQNMGKTPDEILKEIQEKAASDSSQAPS